MEEKNKRNTKEKKSNVKRGTYTLEALEYIAKIADGGCRDSISLMDKCLAYNTDLTLENVVQALGTTDYDTMFKLANNICERCNDDIITCIEELYNSGKDIKQFVKQFTQFLLDVQKFSIIEKWEYISIPKLPDYEKALRDCNYDVLFDVLDIFVKLSSEIKYSSTPKYDVEAAILLYTLSEEEK